MQFGLFLRYMCSFAYLIHQYARASFHAILFVPFCINHHYAFLCTYIPQHNKFQLPLKEDFYLPFNTTNFNSLRRETCKLLKEKELSATKFHFTKEAKKSWMHVIYGILSNLVFMKGHPFLTLA